MSREILAAGEAFLAGVGCERAQFLGRAREGFWRTSTMLPLWPYATSCARGVFFDGILVSPSLDAVAAASPSGGSTALTIRVAVGEGFAGLL